jgi:hypothetical protein
MPKGNESTNRSTLFRVTLIAELYGETQADAIDVLVKAIEERAGRDTFHCAHVTDITIKTVPK